MKIVIKCHKCGSVIFKGDLTHFKHQGILKCPHCGRLSRVKKMVLRSVTGDEICRVDLF